MSDIVYKCVDILGDDISSMKATGKAEVKYRIGEFVEAPEWLAEQGYHLLVFDNIYDARNMLCDIFKAEAEEEMPLPPRLFSNELENGLIEACTLPWPRGTKMYKRVKLLEQII